MEEKKELLDQDERVVEIELERLRGFVNHPFKVQADSQMIELQESIKKYGILNPLIWRWMYWLEEGLIWISSIMYRRLQTAGRHSR